MGRTLEQDYKELFVILRNTPGGPVVRNLPANAGDAGWIPGSGRSHMLHVP